MVHRWYFKPRLGTIFGAPSFRHKSGMSQADPSFHLRLPVGLQKRLKRSAIDNDRSLNAEILARLERSYSDDESDRAQVAKLLAEALGLLDKGRKR